MSNRITTQKITEREYLDAEEASDIKHEFVNGYVFAMSGATNAHNIIRGNIFSAIHAHLRGSSCQVFINDMKLNIKSEDSYYYPDIIVSCETLASSSKFTKTPIILVEVLSPSTASIDKREKLMAYKEIASLQEYFIVHQNRQRVEIHRRLNSKEWEVSTLDFDKDLVFESMPGGSLSIPMSLVYEKCNPPTIVKEDEGSYEFA